MGENVRQGRELLDPTSGEWTGMTAIGGTFPPCEGPNFMFRRKKLHFQRTGDMKVAKKRYEQPNVCLGL